MSSKALIMAGEVTYAELSFPSTLRDTGKCPTANPQKVPDFHNDEQLDKRTAIQRRSSIFTCAIILLVILCIFLLILSVTLGVLYAELSEKDTLSEESNGCSLHNEGPWYEYCPEGWRPWKGKCYFASNETKNWIDSMYDCINRDSHLAMLKNLTDLFQMLMNSSQNNNWWIGIKKMGNTWLWLDGTQIRSSVRDFSGWTCAEVTPAGLSPQQCGIQHRWICEKPIIKLQFELDCNAPAVSVNGVKQVGLPKEAM
ncbi:C-type lectin domain family 2 member E isoform X2 [Microcaecilia unicolor]|uniref:C-type lectin domain family 2 member E-like isoform X2 n=1 Tax=Microcaecilia unicolor TaxID=1415580 RepID=A0A6P7XC28_9AMPH|nr:C-type lectin domain family 2 member E-like isoform X2 [Microcaecilia unicolor]